jgi:OmpA-OmpF porin, OOP family
MSASLIDLLKGYVTPDLISQASSVLGESEGGVSKAVSAAIPTLLTGLVHKSTDSNAMGSVMNLITESGSGGSILSNLPSLLSGSSDSGIGGKLLGSLFGDKVSSITNMISGASGVSGGAMSSILAMVGPMIMGHFSKTGVSASGLTSLLSSEKDNILAAAPAGLGSLLGMSAPSMSAKASAPSMSSSSGDSGSGFPKWLLPLLLLAAAAFAIYYFTKGCSAKKADTEMGTAVDTLSGRVDDDITDKIDSAATGAKEVVADAAGAVADFFKFKLPNGVELNASKTGIENQLVTWENDKTKVVDKTTWFNFDRLLFETGKSTLKPESQEQLKNMVEILKAYPTMELKLGGYTDNKGAAASNLKLSDDRAKSIMAEMVKMGIDAKRLAAEGYGDQFPVASNDTEEGRAQNRRIAARVTKK